MKQVKKDLKPDVKITPKKKKAAILSVPQKIIVRSEIKKQKEEIKKEEKAQVISPKPKAKKQEMPKKSVPSQKKAKEQQILTERPPTIAGPKQPPKSPLLTMSLGYGPSLGSGIGGFIQLNTHAGFSFHIGAGYYPTSYFYSECDWVKNSILYSAGIKYYLPFGNNRIRPYLDL